MRTSCDYSFSLTAKPEDKVRDILKGNGFKWSPKNGCWQRQLTANAKYALSRVIKELEKLEETA